MVIIGPNIKFDIYIIEGVTKDSVFLSQIQVISFLCNIYFTHQESTYSILVNTFY